MCKLRRITHKYNINPFGIYSISEWIVGVYTSIKTKNKISSYSQINDWFVPILGCTLKLVSNFSIAYTDCKKSEKNMVMRFQSPL